MNKKDEEKFLTSFTKSYKNMIATSENTYGYSNHIFRYRVAARKYSEEDIKRILDSGSLEARIALSRYYFDKGGFYQRILLHYATLLKYVGIIIPNPAFGKTLSETYIEKKYNSAVGFVDAINLPKLCTDIAIKVLRDGCYYGIIQGISNTSVSILDLPTLYCRTRFKNEDGSDLIEFDVTYFNTITDVEERKSALALYPKEVVNWYKRYQAGKVNSKWVFIDASIGICMPMLNGYPIFLDIIPATIEYDQARDINKKRDLEEIRKIIVQKIPHLQDGGLLFEPDEAEVMHDGTVKMMQGNENVSVLTTYADVDGIVSKTSNDNATATIEKELSNVYSVAGVSPQLFGTDSNLSLETSINNDMALMMMFAHKVETLITYMVNFKFSNSNISFKYTMLPVTYYNENKYIDTALKMANSGYSFIIPAVALGVSQRELGNIKDLENDVLGLKEKLIPLSTSYTESGNSPGRPEKPLEEKSAKTIANEESLDSGGSNG